MIKLLAMIIVLGSQSIHLVKEAEAGLEKAKLTFTKLLYADCDTPDPGDPDWFE